MDFVIDILETVFHKQPAVAYRLMLQVHVQGRAICGMYPHEVAETKVATVRDQATRHGVSAPGQHGRGLTADVQRFA